MARQTNQKAWINPDTSQRGVFVLSERYDASIGPWHAHRKAQLIHASDGVLTISTLNGFWTVPPHRAVWILPNQVHQVCATKEFVLLTLYAPEDAVTLPKDNCVVAIDSLLSELLNAAAKFGSDYPAQGPEQRLVSVIVDRLGDFAMVPSYLPMPKDPRMVKLTSILLANPSDARVLPLLASSCGMTARTAARLFVGQTGLTFGKWRQQLRMVRAMEHLSNGLTVTRSAIEVGYTDVSAFIATFKAVFGETPVRYVR